MQNPFSNPASSMANLTAALNLLPNRYGRLESLNLFPARLVRFRQILIEEKNGVLNLLPTLPVGSPGTVGQRDKRKMRSFVVPHIPHDDVVLPDEVQGLRAFGSETQLETIAGVMARHLEAMRNKHAITLEHLRMTYDQGREMAQHARLSEITGVAVYFTDPHSPWQRGINENTNGLLRQYFPKGSDLAGFSQAEFDAVAWQLNTRPRKSLNFRCPTELFMPESFDFFKHHHQLVALRT